MSNERENVSGTINEDLVKAARHCCAARFARHSQMPVSLEVKQFNPHS